jgi:ribosomal protein S18 acetylase RimI-like enzyme
MIQKITAIETFSVRHPVLRAGKPIGTCNFDGDDLPSTTHFGYFDKEILVGIITLKLEKNNNFNPENQYRIRGMAVLENFRKVGIGSKLVLHAEDFVKQNNGNLIWFNARIVALNFYKSLGYQTLGEAFEMGDIGTHFLMFKKL